MVQGNRTRKMNELEAKQLIAILKELGYAGYYDQANAREIHVIVKHFI